MWMHLYVSRSLSLVTADTTLLNSVFVVKPMDIKPKASIDAHVSGMGTDANVVTAKIRVSAIEATIVTVYL